MSQLKERVRIGLAAVSMSVVTGCATYDRMQPAPSIGPHIVVRLTADELTTWADLPIGAYRVPDSQVIVSGHQRGDRRDNGASLGLVGLLIVDQIETHREATAVETTEAALHLRVDDELRSDVTTAIADPSLAGRLSLDAGESNSAGRLDVSPAVILTFVDGNKVRPFVVLKASLGAWKGDAGWSTRYFASTGAERPLEGDDGWLVNNGAALKASISASLAQAVKVMLADVAHPYPRDVARLVRVRAHVPYQPQRFDLVGYSLIEDEHYLAIATKITDDAVISGVSIIDKSLATAQSTTESSNTAVVREDTARARAKQAKIERRDAALAARRPPRAPVVATPDASAPQGAIGGSDAAATAPASAAPAPAAPGSAAAAAR